MTYNPDVALTAYDEDGAEIRYVQMEPRGDFDFVPQKTGEVKVCLKSLHQRQKLFNFAFEVSFKDVQTTKLETDF